MAARRPRRRARAARLACSAAATLALALTTAACSPGAGSRTTSPTAPVTTVVLAPNTTLSPGGWGHAERLGNLDDPKLVEASGLVASRRNPGLYWSHNDSGDDPILYCITDHGHACGEWRVPNAENFDWEDIAAGPGRTAGVPDLYAGDIGDNIDQRSEIVVYRVAEPIVPGGGLPADQQQRTDPAQALRLRYPDGPHDAEALLVHPTTGDVYVVTKEANPGVYVARAPVSTTSTTTLQLLSHLTVPGGDFEGLVTGGDIAPDATRLALCTYGGGYELRLPANAANFDAIWSAPLEPVDLGFRPQGESVAYSLDGKALLATSERPGGLNAPVNEVRRS